MGEIVQQTALQELGQHRVNGTARGMVFCTTTAQVDEFYNAWALGFALDGIRLNRHHAGMSAGDRIKELENFGADTQDIVLLVCTTAAGSGLDFSNLYCVVHVGYPYTLLNFVQEVGRADRKRLGKATFSLVITNDKAIRERAAEIDRMANAWSGMRERELYADLVGLHRRALEYVKHGVAAEAGFPGQCLRNFVHHHAGLHGQVFPCVMRRGSTLCTTCLMWDKSRREVGLGGAGGAGGRVGRMQHDESGENIGGGGGEGDRPPAGRVSSSAPLMIPGRSSAGLGNRSLSSSGRGTVSGLGATHSSSSSTSFASSARASRQLPAPPSLSVDGRGDGSLSVSASSSLPLHRPGALPGTNNVLLNATAASSSSTFPNTTATQLDPSTHAQRVRTNERRDVIVRVATMYQTSLQDIGRRCGACLAHGETGLHDATQPHRCKRFSARCLRCHGTGHGTKACRWTRVSINAALGQGQGRREVRLEYHFKDLQHTISYIYTYTTKNAICKTGANIRRPFLVLHLLRWGKRPTRSSLSQ